MAEPQTIPARHGVATFVPAGQTIKIINTSGTQVVDTWAFALPKPDPKSGAKEGEKEQEKDKKGDKKPDSKKEEKKEESPEEEETKTPSKAAPKKRKSELPSQEDAEKATQEGLKQTGEEAKNATPQKNTWSSYVPSLGLTSSSKKPAQEAASKKDETEQQKNSRTWSSYFPSGQGFSSYIPTSASNTVTAFAKDHQRDMSKSYLEQLQDFSKTPVGAAGLSAITGSGYSGSLYAGYQAYNASHIPNAPAMEYMSMPHTRTSTLHLRPRVQDTLVSNLREPIMTLTEDTSPGIHDTLIPACDPQRYKALELEDWEHHGSCAENLVLALKELNERAGLKGAKGVGADVTINNVPAPLNLFMNIPWDEEGGLKFDGPAQGQQKGDYVRLRAERDVVVVMSACPNDVQGISGGEITDAQFLVEEEGAEVQQKGGEKQAAARPAAKKMASSASQAQQKKPSTDAGSDAPAAKKAVPQRRTAPVQKGPQKPTSAAPQQQKKPAAPQQKPSEAGQAAQAPKKKPAPKPVQPQKKKPVEGGDKDAKAGVEKDGKDGKDGKDANGAAPVERKKPRKLNAKPKPEALKEEA